jgi:hypothetical protein
VQFALLIWKNNGAVCSVDLEKLRALIKLISSVGPALPVANYFKEINKR